MRASRSIRRSRCRSSLPAGEPVAKIVAPLRRHLLDRKTFVDRPGAADLRVDPGLARAAGIGMVAEAARHRRVRAVRAGEDRGQPAFVEGEMLARFIGPGPFARRVAEDELGAGGVCGHDVPRRQPALAVERARVARHVRPQHDLAAAKDEAAATDPVREGHEREGAEIERSVISPFDTGETRYFFAGSLR